MYCSSSSRDDVKYTGGCACVRTNTPLDTGGWSNCGFPQGFLKPTVWGNWGLTILGKQAVIPNTEGVQRRRREASEEVIKEDSKKEAAGVHQTLTDKKSQWEGRERSPTHEAERYWGAEMRKSSSVQLSMSYCRKGEVWLTAAQRVHYGKYLGG